MEKSRELLELELSCSSESFVLSFSLLGPSLTFPLLVCPLPLFLIYSTLIYILYTFYSFIIYILPFFYSILIHSEIIRF